MGTSRLEIINNLWTKLTLVSLLIGILGFFFVEKINKKPILIGFCAQLTGKQAELGVQERNGVQLAIEKINETGGILGHKVELIIRDDVGIPEKAQLMDRELIKEGVTAIIGHATSAQTMAGLKVTNPAKVVMIAPTVSTPELSGLDDYFFRVYPSFKDSSQAFAKYIYQHNAITRMAIIYDIDNYAYSKAYSKFFADKFKSLGGSIASEVAFSSMTQSDFSPLIMKLQEAKAEGVLIIASDMDTAFIAQRIRLMEWQVPLFTSSWAPTENLINNGGHAVEKMEFEQAYELANHSKMFSDFQFNYQARFGDTPSFGAALAYDSAMVLAEGLKKARGKSEGLRQALIHVHDYSGLMGTFSFDEFGDVKRSCYIGSIRNQKFTNLDKLIPSNYEVSK